MAQPARENVILLHGFGAVPATMWPLGWTFRQAGYRTFIPFYSSWRAPLMQIVDRLSEQVRNFVARREGPVHFVGHSMGGLIIRALLQNARPDDLGRVVMLGTPNAGSEIADHLAGNRWASLILGQARPALVTRREGELIRLLGEVNYPVGVIAGNRCVLGGPLASLLPFPHDGKVSVAATHLIGQASHIVVPVTHTLLPSHGTARRQALHFIRNGHFIDDTVGRPAESGLPCCDES